MWIEADDRRERKRRSGSPSVPFSRGARRLAQADDIRRITLWINFKQKRNKRHISNILCVSLWITAKRVATQKIPCYPINIHAIPYREARMPFRGRKRLVGRGFREVPSRNSEPELKPDRWLKKRAEFGTRFFPEPRIGSYAVRNRGGCKA